MEESSIFDRSVLVTTKANLRKMVGIWAIGERKETGKTLSSPQYYFCPLVIHRLISRIEH